MSAYEGGQNSLPEASSAVQLVACRQRDGSRLWAMRDGAGCVLNKLGERPLSVRVE